MNNNGFEVNVLREEGMIRSDFCDKLIKYRCPIFNLLEPLYKSVAVDEIRNNLIEKIKSLEGFNY